MRGRMWLKTAYIEGFGALRAVRLPELGPGLCIFTGPNEAGKSTLLAFLRAVLFDLPRSQARQNRYEPASGGRHGGRLVLERQDGLFTVERFWTGRRHAPTVYLPDGSTGGQEELTRVLGGASEDLFRNVFAFGLSELESFETLQDAAVRDRIYSAGVTGANASIQSVKGLADNQMKALFLEKGKGDRQLINRVVGRLDALDSGARELRSKLAEYDRLYSEYQELSEEVEELGRRSDEVSKDAIMLRRLLDAFPDWSEICGRRSELSAIAEHPGFPADGAEEFQDLLRQTQKLEDRIQDHEGRIREYELSLEKLSQSAQADADVLALSAEIHGLAESKGEYRSALDGLPGARARRELLDKNVALALRRLGPGWTKDRVSELDTSVRTKQELEAHRVALGGASESVRAAERTLRPREAELREGEEKERTAQERFAVETEPEEKDEGRLMVQQKLLASARSHLLQLERLSAKQRGDEERLRDLARQRQYLEGFRGRYVPLPMWPAWAGGAVGLVAFLLAAASPIRQALGTPSGGSSTSSGAAPAGLAGRVGDLLLAGLGSGSPSLLVVTGLFLIVGAIFYGVISSRSRRGPGSDLRRELMELDALLGQLERESEAGREEKGKVQGALESLRTQLEELFPGSVEEVDPLMLELQERLVALRSWRERGREVDEASRAVRDRMKALEAAREELRTALKAERGLRELWAVWLAEAGLGTGFGAGSQAEAETGFRTGVGTRHEMSLETSGGQPGTGVDIPEAQLGSLGAGVAGTGELQDQPETGAGSGLQTGAGSQVGQGLIPGTDTVPEPAVVLAVIGEVESARREIQAAGEALNHEVELQTRIQGIEARIETLCGAVGMRFERHQAAALIGELEDRLGAAMKTKDEAARLAREMERERWAIAPLSSEREQVESEQDALLLSAGAVDREDFLRKARDSEKRAVLEVRIGDLETSLQRRGWAGDEMGRLEEALAGVSVADLEARLAAAERLAGEQDDERTQKLDERGRLRNEIQALEGSTELTSVLFEREAALTELRAAAGRWSSLALLRRVMDEVLRRYEREQQPEDIRTASEFFGRINGGRYRTVISSLDDDGLYVEKPSGERIDIAKLSRGTQEQLYLSLRFGLIRRYAAKAEALPVVMDDILVNFDPERVRAAAQAISDLASEGQQVLFFTCHPETVEVFREVQPQVPVCDIAGLRSVAEA